MKRSHSLDLLALVANAVEAVERVFTDSDCGAVYYVSGQHVLYLQNKPRMQNFGMLPTGSIGVVSSVTEQNVLLTGIRDTNAVRNWYENPTCN